MMNHAAPSRAELTSERSLDRLIGNSDGIHQLHELIERVSGSCCPILLLGETGTGKELVARAIHFTGVRRKKEFVPVDCSALTPTLVESELFGHAKGAFTGADQSTQGLLVAANEGTIFLDEIGEFPLFLQAKLLRALQEKEIRPVGSTERIPISGRIIAATNRDLEAGVQLGTFRQDLYFRLNVVQIKLPALREHKIDIPLLVHYFLTKFADPVRPVCEISDEALRRLMAYDWPGNVRQLENVIESAVALSSNDTLTIQDLAAVPQNAITGRTPDCNEMVSLEELERRAIFHAIRETDGDKLAAAKFLGVGKTTLYRKLQRYGFDGPRFRGVPVAEEDSRVEAFLICVGLNCRTLVNLQEHRKRIAGPDDLLRDCPTCGHFLSRFCPYCRQPLEVIWRVDLPHCKNCDGQLKAVTA